MNFDVVDTMIHLVYKKPPLWNKNHKQHLHRHTVDRCWSEISKEMNEDEHKLRKKWKYLRDQFSVELGKISDPQDGARGTKWPYFQSLLFLKEVVKPRKSVWNLKRFEKRSSSTSGDKENSDSNDEVYLKEESQGRGDDEVLHFTQDDSVDTPDNSLDAPDERVSNTDPLKTESLSRLDRKRMNNSNDNQMKRRRVESFEEQFRCRLQSEDDEHMCFFKSILPHVRKIPAEKLLSFRNSVQEIVDRYAYQQAPGPDASSNHQ